LEPLADSGPTPSAQDVNSFVGEYGFIAGSHSAVLWQVELAQIVALALPDYILPL